MANRRASIDRVAESEAIAAYKRGDRRAGERLLVMHAGLIALCAKRGGRGLEPEDALQEARIWFLDCVLRFNTEENTRLSTYVFNSVGHRVRRFAKNTATAVRIPVHAQRRVHADPTSRIALAAKAAANVISIDAPVHGDEPEFTHHDILADRSPTPEKSIEIEDRAEKRDRYITDKLSGISEQQRRLVTWYYFDGLTFGEIGRRLGRSGEAVRQALSKALIELRRRMHA